MKVAVWVQYLFIFLWICLLKGVARRDPCRKTMTVHMGAFGREADFGFLK